MDIYDRTTDENIVRTTLKVRLNILIKTPMVWFLAQFI